MLKNILAAVGLYSVAKRGYEHYQEYSELKRDKEERDGEAKQIYGQQADSQSHKQPQKLRLKRISNYPKTISEK